MNVLFRCCQCNSEKRKVIDSYSRNKTYKFEEDLCHHFYKIELSWKTKYGILTLGWKVQIYDVSVKCHKCERRLTFSNQTFNSKNPDYEEVRECCDNVIIYSAHEGKYYCSDAGLKLQKRINQQIKLLKCAEEKLQKLKEEAKRLEKEEKLRREKEEKKKGKGKET